MAGADFATQPTLRVAVQKPKFGIYYALLIVALLAMIVACIYLYAYIKFFGGFGAIKGKVAAVTHPQAYSVAAAAAGRAPSSLSKSSSAAGSSFTS